MGHQQGLPPRQQAVLRAICLVEDAAIPRRTSLVIAQVPNHVLECFGLLPPTGGRARFLAILSSQATTLAHPLALGAYLLPRA